MHPFCRSTTIAVTKSNEELDRRIAELTDSTGADVDFDTWRNNLQKLPNGKHQYVKPIDISSGSGIIEREMLPRKVKNGSHAVDWAVIQSDEYSQKFSKLSTNKKVSSAIEARAKWALSNRDGKSTEELYAISLSDGREIARITNQNYDSAVKRTTKFTKELNQVDSTGEKILLIHNHPKGYPPSPQDINTLLKNENVSGITVGHNGSVYRYTRPSKEISDIDWNVALRHFKEYTEITSMEKALVALSREFGFEFEII